MCDSEIYNQYAASWVPDGWGQLGSGIFLGGVNMVLSGTNNVYLSMNAVDKVNAHSKGVYAEYRVLNTCTHTFKFRYTTTSSTRPIIKIFGYDPVLDELVELFESDPLTISSSILEAEFSFTAAGDYTMVYWEVLDVTNGVFDIYSWSMSMDCNQCDEEQDTSDKYLITQDQVTSAIDKAKCCYGDIKTSQLDKLKAGLEVCKDDEANLIKLSAAIFTLEKYCKGGCNCVSDNDAYACIELINSICGCQNCS